VTVDTKNVAADASDREQFLAGWLGLAVCGLVAAVIWFFAIKAIWVAPVVETSALECSSIYGVGESAECARP